MKRWRSFAAPGVGKALDALTDNPLPDTLIVTPALSAEHRLKAGRAQGGDRRHGRRADRAARHRMGEAPAWHAGYFLRRVVLLTGALLGAGWSGALIVGTRFASI